MIGEYSIIGKDVKIGRDSRVWHHCNLYGCKIGNNTQIGSYSEIKEGVIIGDNCRLQAFVFIPEGTRIGNNVFIGPNVTFLNDKYPTAKKAIKGDWNLEAVVVEDNVSIGGGCVILPGVRIEKDAFIGAGSVVTKDVKGNYIVCGNPAKQVGNIKDEKYRRLI